MALLDISMPHRTSRRPFSLFSFALKAAELHRQRSALRRLDDRALADIGLTRTEAEAEANKPVWDVPYTWHN